MNVIETQVSLQDNLWQYFVEPNEFSILNFNTQSSTTASVPKKNQESEFFELQIGLDTEI